MKTLQIGMGWFPEQAGGLNRVYYDCVRYLPKADIHIRGLVAGSSQVARTTGGQIQAFAAMEAPLLGRWQQIRQRFKQLTAAEDFSLVVSHFGLYTFPLLDQLGAYPVAMHFQGPWALEGKVEGNSTWGMRAKWLLEWSTYRQVQQFIVLSDAFRQTLHREYGIPYDRIHIVPPGVDTTRFDTGVTPEEAQQRLGWPSDRPILLAVRRLARRMGLENLIAAIAQVRQQHPDVLLLIAGKGTLKAELEQQIQDLDLAGHVKLLGFVSDTDLALAYRAATLSVVPTVSLEGFGLIVIESLANGTPVMGTPVDSIPEILTPFCPDLLFEGTRPEHLAQGISEALSGQRQLPSAAACQRYVEDNYTWPVIAERIKTVYQLAMES
ncbi:glycosyltransferase family 4 protein [Leptolyngbya sp. KIOST-1]|uniref:glycosyltransferase family 4 protein n=1 Tax=Leptolyngbya sp. KIOST-1 TaxID=1229172 RepID=UPI00056C5423|nr:glycosyltransferase family 4 protein [Leptolyngbya sp. KIOST-1]